MDIAGLSRDERHALAADTSTDPDVLAALASDVFLLPTLLENPSLPAGAKDAILRDFPHLRDDATFDLPTRDGVGPSVDSTDAALDRMRRRQVAANRAYARRNPPVVTRPYTYGAQGDRTPVRIYYAPPPGTNGFAIASFILSILGISLLGVIFGHVARSQIARSGEQGDGFAVAGVVIGYVGLVVMVFAVLTSLGA